MDDAELRRGQEEQRRAELLRQLPRQVQRDAAEVCVAQEVIQVVGEQLKHQAQVVPEHEVPLQVHCREGTDRDDGERNEAREGQWRPGVHSDQEERPEANPCLCIWSICQSGVCPQVPAATQDVFIWSIT